MGIIVKPFTFGDGNLSVAAEHNADFDTIYAQFNGNIDDTNIKAGAQISGSKIADLSIPGTKLANASVPDSAIDYSSTKLIKAGIGGLKFARGSIAFTLIAGGALPAATTFSSASDDGAPGFTTTPRIMLTVFCATANAAQAKILTKSNLQFTIQVNGTGTDAGTVEWFAIGA